MGTKTMQKVESNNNAILLLSCPDRKGIVASVSEFIYKNNGNIVHADQHLDSQEEIWAQGGLELSCLEVVTCLRVDWISKSPIWRYLMAKSQDKKRPNDKKKAQKSIKEKRAAKRAKKAEKQSTI